MTLTVTKFHWVRHAPVKAMMPGRIYGQRDVGCDLRDEDRLKDRAAQLPPDALWVTSSLSRTKKTAKALAQQMGQPIRPLAYKDLMEQNFGLWQSKTWDELEDDPQATAFWEDPAGTLPPDGESFEQLCVRTHKMVRHLVKKHAGQELVCVVHAGTIRAACGLALDLTPPQALRLKVDTLSISQVSHFDDTQKGETWAVDYINR